jgi:PilZ domain-containing protein
MAANKRKHPRVRARGVAANVRAQEVLKTGCVVENISAGGLLVRTDQVLEPGTPVVMDLVRPGMKKLLKVSGRVVGRVEKVPNSPATVPGLRVQFDPMPDETNERLVQLLRDLGLSLEEGTAWSLTQPAVAPMSPPPEPRTMPGAPPAPAPAPDAQITAPHAIWSTPPPPAPAPRPVSPVTTPSAPFGPPFLPADMQQITWAPLDDEPLDEPERTEDLERPEEMEATRAMSEEAVRSALEAAELTPPGGKLPAQASETAQAARAPPPILPVPSTTPPPGAKGEGEGAGDPRLMVQIRGLLMELGDVQNRLDVKEREWDDLESEIERLRRENQELRQKLERAEELLQQNGIKDPYERF